MLRSGFRSRFFRFRSKSGLSTKKLTALSSAINRPPARIQSFRELNVLSPGTAVVTGRHNQHVKLIQGNAAQVGSVQYRHRVPDLLLKIVPDLPKCRGRNATTHQHRHAGRFDIMHPVRTKIGAGGDEPGRYGREGNLQGIRGPLDDPVEGIAFGFVTRPGNDQGAAWIFLPTRLERSLGVADFDLML